MNICMYIPGTYTYTRIYAFMDIWCIYVSNGFIEILYMSYNSPTYIVQVNDFYYIHSYQMMVIFENAFWKMP